jgi:mannose-6-phosphate isomerase-like protein (cupin superfamily)
MKSAAYELSDVLRAHAAAGQLWHEFLRVPELSMGIYVLPAGADDPQYPHNEDEVYYVVSGNGVLRAGEIDHPAQPGSILFVAKHIPHRFHSITEELRVLVFFAPAHT